MNIKLTNSPRSRRLAVAAMSLALATGAAACSSDTTATTGNGNQASTSTPAEPTPEVMTASDQVFGSGCAAVPADGAGSFDGMAADPVATAASNNPLLSTLVTAVGAAGLGDTLNSADGITVFAPTNEAFEAMDQKTLQAALDDPEGLLTTVLTYHVVAGELAPADLAGTHTSLQGGEIEITGSGEDFTINGSAGVVCGNVTTGNATVYLIDSVLLPAA